LAQQTAANALLDVEVHIDPEAESGLEHADRETIFYVAADALGNVARHARARRVVLALRRENGAVVLDVQDDGVGFDPEGPVAGLGLRNMRERAFNSGARLEIESSSGSGTKLALRLPERAGAPV